MGYRDEEPVGALPPVRPLAASRLAAAVVIAVVGVALLPAASHPGAGYRSCKPVYDLLYGTDDISDAQKIRSKGAECGEARMLVAAWGALGPVESNPASTVIIGRWNCTRRFPRLRCRARHGSAIRFRIGRDIGRGAQKTPQRCPRNLLAEGALFGSAQVFAAPCGLASAAAGAFLLDGFAEGARISVTWEGAKGAFDCAYYPTAGPFASCAGAVQRGTRLFYGIVSWRNTRFAIPTEAAYCGDVRRSGDQLYSVRALGSSCDQARESLLAQTEGEEYLDNPPGYLCRAIPQPSRRTQYGCGGAGSAIWFTAE